MIKQKYKLKHFTFQYTIILIQIFTIFFSILNLQQKILIFGLLLFVKFKFEGIRMNIVIIFLGIILDFLQWNLLKVLIVSLEVLSIKLLKVYEIPQMPSKIGYKYLNLNSQVEFFYKTQQSKNKCNLNLFNQKIYNIMFDIINKDPRKPSKMPKFFIHFIFNYYTKLYLKNIYKNTLPAKLDKYQVVIISHQLGVKSLFTFALELAQRNYFVIVLSHHEAIRNIYKQVHKNRDFRMDQLVVRSSTVTQVLDFIYDQQKMRNLFECNIQLNYDKIHIMGHSFGGSTALYSSIHQKRITGKIICLDPCAYIIQDKYSYINNEFKNKNKTLILLAEDYYQSHYPQFENDYRMMILKQNFNHQKFLLLRLIGANHASFSEMSLISYGQFQLFNVIQNNDAILYMQLILEYVLAFLMNDQDINNEYDLINYVSNRNEKYRKWIEEVSEIKKCQNNGVKYT